MLYLIILPVIIKKLKYFYPLKEFTHSFEHKIGQMSFMFIIKKMFGLHAVRIFWIYLRLTILITQHE